MSKSSTKQLREFRKNDIFIVATGYNVTKNKINIIQCIAMYTIRTNANNQSINLMHF